MRGGRRRFLTCPSKRLRKVFVIWLRCTGGTRGKCRNCANGVRRNRRSTCWQSDEKDVGKPASGTGDAGARALARSKAERRLRVGSGQRRDPSREVADLLQLAFAVDHLNRLVDRLQRDAVQRRVEVQPLPASARGDRLSAIV